MADSLTVQPNVFSISQVEPDERRPLLEALPPDETNKPEIKLPQPEPEKTPDAGWVDANSLPVDQRAQVYAQVESEAPQAEAPDPDGFVDPVIAFKGNPKALADTAISTKGDLDLKRWATDHPEELKDPQTKATIADAMAILQERGFKFSDVHWDEVLPSVWHLAKGVASWTARGEELIVGGIGRAVAPLDPKSQAEMDKIQKRKAAELVTGTDVGLEGFAGLIDKSAVWGTRKIKEAFGAKKPTERTAQEKLDFLDQEIEATKRKDLTARGHGIITRNVLGGVMKELEADGIELDPEAVNLFAAGDPLTFVAFGKGFHIIGKGGKLLGKATSRGQAITAMNKLRSVQQAAAKAGAEHSAALNRAGTLTAAEEFLAKQRAGVTSAPIPGELPLVDSAAKAAIRPGTQAAIDAAEAAGQRSAAAQTALAASQEEAAAAANAANISAAARAARASKTASPIDVAYANAAADAYRLPGVAGQVARVADATANIADWSAKAAAKAVEFGVDKGLGIGAGAIGAGAKAAQFGTWALRGVAPGIVRNRALTAAPRFFGDIGDHALSRAGALLKGAPEKFGPYTQLASDVGKAALVDIPAGAARGAVMDVGLAVATSESPTDTAHAGLLGTALGLGHGGIFGGARIYRGQHFNPHHYGSTTPIRRLGNFTDLDAATELSLRTSDKSADVESRLSAMREMFGPANVEMHLATDPAQFAEIVRRYLPGMTGEALENARAAGGVNIPNAQIPGTTRTRNLAIFSELSAGEHEGLHGWQRAFSPEANRKLNQLARSEYAREWEQIGRGYMDRIGVTPEQMARYTANGEGWREALIDFTTGSTEWRNERWSEQRIIDEADNYIAGEVVAEVGSSILQTQRGSIEKAAGFPGKLARILGATYDGIGINPFAGAETSQVGIPLKHGAREAIRKELINARETIGERDVRARFDEPGAPGAAGGGAAPTPGLPGAPAPAAGAAAAAIAATAPNTPGVAGGRNQNEIAQDLAISIGEGTAVGVSYHHAPDAPAGSPVSSLQARRDIIELNRNAPNSVRPLWEQTFWPERLIRTRSGEIQVQGWSPEVFAANAHKLARALHERGATSEIPYEIDATTGNFTEAGWRELFADAADFSRNQIAGETGAGGLVVLPREATDRGFTQPPVEGAPGRDITQDRADVINMLLGLPPQRGTRATGAYPRNLVNAAIADATGRAGGLAERTSPTGRQFAGENAELIGVAGREIREVNPLRARLNARNVRPSMIQAIQHLNLARISDVSPSPHAPLVKAREIVASAGFAPKSIADWTKLNPKEVLEEIKAGGKALTITADEIGANATPAEIAALREAQKTVGAESTRLRKEKKIDEAMDAAFAAQFFREAAETAEGRPTLQFAPSTDPRAIKEAAIRLEDGKVYTGSWHGAARNKAFEDGRTDAEVLKATDGFVTGAEEFLNREDSGRRAIQLKQITEADARKMNKDIGRGDEGVAMESFDFERARAFAPKSGKEDASEVVGTYERPRLTAPAGSVGKGFNPPERPRVDESALGLPVEGVDSSVRYVGEDAGLTPHRFSPKADGDDVTVPSPSYKDAADRAKAKGGNLWVRQSPETSNAERVLMVQITPDLMYPNGPDPVSTPYYDKLYSGARKGYERAQDFWELPQWAAVLSHNLGSKADFYAVRDVAEAQKFLEKANYDRVAFSVMDVSKSITEQLLPHIKGTADLGGYAERADLAQKYPNAKVWNDVNSFVADMGLPYKKGFDYRLFRGTEIIPRLELSAGCRHRCTFCTIDRKVTNSPMEEVNQQVDSFADLNGKLVYLNDKTFGQSPNVAEMPRLYKEMKAANPEFDGFVIQTTAAQMKLFTDDFLKDAGIRYVELGVETYNDPILKTLRKPATEKLIDEAVEKLRRNGINFIPNIVIGFPGETSASYGRTMEFLNKNRDVISHVNTYNLAVYKGTEMSEKVKATTEADADENSPNKSFYENPKIHEDFAKQVYDYGTERLNKPSAFSPKRRGDEERIAVEHRSSQPGLTSVDPKYFGKGKATPTDLRGGNKSYFFVKGSKLGQDEPIFGDQAKLNTYEGEIPMAGLYDLRKGKDDPLGWRKTINREEADDIVQDAGYSGMILDTQDGRQVVAMFKPVKVTPAEAKPREIPSDEEITSALSVDKQPYVGAHRDLEPGTPVGLRIDIPAYNKNGTYVITVHEKNAAGRVGKRIGYDSIATVDNPTFFSNERGAEKVREGAPKFPLATVEGEFNPSRRLPRDLSEWTEVGFNPERHSYFYDKNTDEPVVSGTRAVSVGNSVYVKDAQFGNKKDFAFAPKNQFKDESMPEELRKVSAGENFGQTFNSDGSVWTPGDSPVDIVTLASKNIPQKDLNKETFDEAVAPYSEILDNPDVKAGVFSFGKGGAAKVSVDINAVVPQEHRDNSVQFAKDNNQISIWDATKGEEVKTGGTGETVLTTPEAIKAAIDDLIAGNPVKFAPKKNQRGETEGLPGLDVPREYVKATRASMTQKELMERFPEAIVPRNFNPTTGKPLKIPSDIVGSPLYKKFKTELERIKAFSDRLVEFAKQYKDRPEYDLGAKWYSDFTPALKKEFGKNAQKMAELLAATSPRANPRVNFGYAYDAMKSWEAGRFDKIISKFSEGLEMLDNGGWEKYLEGKSGAHTPENALAHWVDEHNLQPRQTNGELYGAQSDAVLKVFARRWFNENRGPKTSNFVRNLIGESNEATIDMWADRTMRWAGYEGMQERWRILAENLEGVDEKHDYRFSEKVFRHAAERLKMQPSALQGALWFAEKARWADNGWARLDLGSYQDEMRRLPELKARYESNLKTQQTAPKGEQLGFDIQPRFK